MMNNTRTTENTGTGMFGGHQHNANTVGGTTGTGIGHRNPLQKAEDALLGGGAAPTGGVGVGATGTGTGTGHRGPLQKAEDALLGGGGAATTGGVNATGGGRHTAGTGGGYQTGGDGLGTGMGGGHHTGGMGTGGHHTAGVGTGATHTGAGLGHTGAGATVPGTKPSVGQRVMGQAEKIAGELTNNPNMVAHGEQKKAGMSGNLQGTTGTGRF